MLPDQSVLAGELELAAAIGRAARCRLAIVAWFRSRGLALRWIGHGPLVVDTLAEAMGGVKPFAGEKGA